MWSSEVSGSAKDSLLGIHVCLKEIFTSLSCLKVWGYAGWPPICWGHSPDQLPTGCKRTSMLQECIQKMIKSHAKSTWRHPTTRQYWSSGPVMLQRTKSADRAEPWAVPAALIKSDCCGDISRKPRPRSSAEEVERLQAAHWSFWDFV